MLKRSFSMIFPPYFIRMMLKKVSKFPSQNGFSDGNFATRMVAMRPSQEQMFFCIESIASDTILPKR